MKDEVNINLLLDRLYTTGKIDKRYMWALKDYITNLQEENKNNYENGYKEGLIQAEIDNTMGVIEENSDLKSRIDKAIEYINEEQQKIDEMGDNYCYLDEYEINDLLDILQGEVNTPQENLYRYTPEKGFRLVGDE